MRHDNIASTFAIRYNVLPEKDAVFCVDLRFLTPRANIEARETMPVPRYYTPGRMEPALVDLLYTETVLLSLKLP